MDEATRLVVASLYGVTDDRKSHYLLKQETFQSGLLSKKSKSKFARKIQIMSALWCIKFVLLPTELFMSSNSSKGCSSTSEASAISWVALEWKPLAMTVMFDGYHKHHKRLLWLIESPFKSVSVACFYLLPREKKARDREITRLSILLLESLLFCPPTHSSRRNYNSRNFFLFRKSELLWRIENDKSE